MRTRSPRSWVTTEPGKPPPCESSGQEAEWPFRAVTFWPSSFPPFDAFTLNFRDRNVLCTCVPGMCGAHCSTQCSPTYTVSFDPCRELERAMECVYCLLCAGEVVQWEQEPGPRTAVSGLRPCKPTPTRHLPDITVTDRGDRAMAVTIIGPQSVKSYFFSETTPSPLYEGWWSFWRKWKGCFLRGVTAW